MLGPIDVAINGVPVHVRGQRPRALLGILALSVGEPVSSEAIIDRLWGSDELPLNPRGSVYTYVQRLRAVLGPSTVVRDSGGYRLALDPDDVDVVRFLTLLEDARVASGADEYQLLVEALDLWRGSPFQESLGDWLTEEGDHLVERYLAAIERRSDLDLEAGRHGDLIPELRDLMARFPLRESMCVRLLQALDGAGRRAEALESYESIRHRLADALGVGPGTELQQLFGQLLQDPQDARPIALPQQLPEVAALVGRDDHLARLDEVVSDRARVIVIHGAGGVGKTSLAVEWAHGVTGAYPDGQLFIDLRGYGPGKPMEPLEAVTTLLEGVLPPGAEIPTHLDAASALLRTSLADRHMLFVLDNARDAQQVRPLIPVGDNLAVVTSRSQLSGLAARENAQLVAVDTLTPEASLEFLRSRLGADIAESQARELGDLCGNLPLALAVGAHRAAMNPELALPALIEELRSEANRLDALESPDDPLTDVRAVLSWSYQALTADSAQMFRALGAHSGQSITVDAAAALADVSVSAAKRLLGRLTLVNLLQQSRPGEWRMHDLLHAYAMECLSDVDGETVPVRLRLIRYYLHSTAHAVELLGHPERRSAIGPMGGSPGDVHSTRFADYAGARAWLDAEWSTIQYVARLAARQSELLQAICQLVYKLGDYLILARPPAEALALQEIAIAAAREVDYPLGEALVTCDLGVSQARSGDLVAAERTFQAALTMCSALGQQRGEQNALGSLGRLNYLRGDHAEAIAWLNKAFSLCKGRGQPVAEVTCQINLSLAHQGLGDLDATIATAQRALDLSREANYRDGETEALATLAAAHHTAGNMAEAEATLLQALKIHQRNDDRWGSALTWYNLGKIAAERQDSEQAREYWLRALLIIDEIGIMDNTYLSRAELVARIEGTESVLEHSESASN